MDLSTILQRIIEYMDKHVDLIESNIDDLIFLLKEDDKIDIEQLTNYSDQEIYDTLAILTQDAKYERYSKSLTYIKSSLFAEKMDADAKKEVAEEEKETIGIFFRDVGLPAELDVRVEDNRVTIKYDFSIESELRKQVNELIAWGDKAVETFSSTFKVPMENINYIKNISEYLDFISSFESINYVSRGQRNCRFPLVPSLHRIHQNNYRNHSAMYESLFKQKVIFYDNKLESKSTEELRAYGQHFGLPTNYLDFTEAHLISLLFSVEQYDYQENHSVVYFVDAVSHNKEVIKDEIKLVDFSDKDLKSTKERNYSDKSYFIKVGNSSERIHFQKGCFLKVEPGDSLDGMLEKHTKVAIIDRDSKKNILIELFNLGINFENIYPDKDNMVKTIKFMYEEI